MVYRIKNVITKNEYLNAIVVKEFTRNTPEMLISTKEMAITTTNHLLARALLEVVRNITNNKLWDIESEEIGA